MDQSTNSLTSSSSSYYSTQSNLSDSSEINNVEKELEDNISTEDKTKNQGNTIIPQVTGTLAGKPEDLNEKKKVGTTLNKSLPSAQTAEKMNEFLFTVFEVNKEETPLVYKFKSKSPNKKEVQRQKPNLLNAKSQVSVNTQPSQQPEPEDDNPFSGIVELFDETTIPPAIGQQVPPPVPQVPVAQVPVAQVPVAQPVTLQSIRDKLTARDKSTQTILSGIIADLKILNVTFETTSTLEDPISGKIELEPYTVDSYPDKTFYKLKTTYTITAQINGNEEKFSLPREIYTTATTPESAKIAASSYMDTMINLAHDSGRLTNQAGRQYNTTDPQHSEVMKQTIFKLQFSYDASGRPKTLTNIQTDIELANQNMKVNFGLKQQDESNYQYVQRLGNQKLEKVPKGSVKPGPGVIIYQSERDALLNTPHTVKADLNTYARLEKDVESMDKKLNDIKNEIQQKEAELQDIKKQFRSQPFFKWMGSKTSTEFKEYLTGIDALENLDPNLAGISPTMKTNITAYKNTQVELQAAKAIIGNEKRYQEELANLEKLQEKVQANITDPSQPLSDYPVYKKKKYAFDTAIVRIKANHPELTFSQPPPIAPPSPLDEIKALIKARKDDKSRMLDLEKQLKEIEDKIAVEQKPFNDSLLRLRTINQELQTKKDELESLHQAAKAKLNTLKNDPAALDDPEARKIAEKVLKQIPEKRIDELGNEIQGNQHFMNRILARLNRMGAGNGIGQAEIEINEQPYNP